MAGQLPETGAFIQSEAWESGSGMLALLGRDNLG